MMILIGSTLFSLTFTAINGNDWVKALFKIAFILLPLLLPVPQELGVNLVYLGVLIGMVLQTSFLTPPVGFSLFYLRSVWSKNDYTDKITGGRIKGMSTGPIYRGAMTFVILQCVMVGDHDLEAQHRTDGPGRSEGARRRERRPQHHADGRRRRATAQLRAVDGARPWSGIGADTIRAAQPTRRSHVER